MRTDKPHLSSKLERYTVHYPNAQEYRSLKQEIFTRDTYYFETSSRAPVILDAGAHIGMATLYFKKLYPHARITAFEPNPESIAVFEQNIFENMLDEVTLIPKALSAVKESATFYHDATADRWDSTAGFSRGAWTGDQNTTGITVQTTQLSEFLDQPVDLLKMDIEGAEEAVLHEAFDQLRNVRHVFVEFHPTAQQSLSRLRELLSDAGFRVTLWKKGHPVQPHQANGLVLIEGTRE